MKMEDGPYLMGMRNCKPIRILKTISYFMNTFMEIQEEVLEHRIRPAGLH